MRGSWTKRTAVIAVAIAAATAVAGSALATRPGGGPGGCGGHLLGRIEHGVQRLTLTPETKQAVYAVLDDARNQQRALGDQLRRAHEEMRATLDAPTPSLDAVLAKADSLGALETQAKKIELAALVKIRGLLTDAQWQELRPARGPRPEAGGAERHML